LLTKIRPYVFTMVDQILTAQCVREIGDKPCRWRNSWRAPYGIPAEDVWSELRDHSAEHA
jgi:hypothetical protein